MLNDGRLAAFLAGANLVCAVTGAIVGINLFTILFNAVMFIIMTTMALNPVRK